MTDDRFTEVGDRVLVGRFAQWDVNVGVVIGTEAVLVVDTRASLRQGQELRALLGRLLDDRAVTHVVNTHVHFDHTFGNGAFPHAVAHAHDNVLASMRADADRVKELFRADPDDAPEYGYTRADVADVLDTPVRVPDVGFAEAAEIDLGERRVHLSYAGRGHTDGDAALTVPDAGVTFLGDLVEQSAHPSLGGDSWPLEWTSTLEAHLRGIGPGSVVVPGHGTPVDRRFVEQQRDELAVVATVVREAYAAGLDLAAALAEPDARLPYPLASLATAYARGFAALEAGGPRRAGEGQAGDALP